MLKLDFIKTFDIVNWDFLFKALRRFGICNRYIKMPKLLFTGAHTMANIQDHSPSKEEQGKGAP